MDLDRGIIIKIGVGAAIMLVALTAFIIKEAAFKEDFAAMGVDGAAASAHDPSGHAPGAATSGAADVGTPSLMPDIIVDVSGAVNDPGIARLKEGSRVIDAVEEAGGLREDADTDYVNLAAFIADGEKIYIPKKGELNGQDGLNSPLSAAVAGTASDFSSISNALKNNKININSAGKDQLMTLKGVGPATADKILDYRQKNGKFTRIEDIMNVSGIGQKTFDKFKERICI